MENRPRPISNAINEELVQKFEERYEIKSKEDLEALLGGLKSTIKHFEDKFTIGFTKEECKKLLAEQAVTPKEERTGACIYTRALPMVAKVDSIKHKVPADVYFAMLWYAIRAAIRTCKSNYIDYLLSSDDEEVKTVMGECIITEEERVALKSIPKGD